VTYGVLLKMTSDKSLENLRSKDSRMKMMKAPIISPFLCMGAVCHRIGRSPFSHQPSF
jgi:hypothetical protein